MTPTECSTFLRKYNEWRQMTAKANNNPDFVKSSTLEMFAVELEEPIMCCNQAIASAKGSAA